MRPHHGDGVVALEPDHRGDVGPEQRLDLTGERVEQRLRLDPVRDERRDAMQRCLLLGEHGKCSSTAA